MTGTRNNSETLASALKQPSPLCRINIRKGLNSLKREIPGGDTFMHLGLQRVDLNAFIYHKCLKSKQPNKSFGTFWNKIWPWLCCYLKANEQIQRENFGKSSFVWGLLGGWVMDADTGGCVSMFPPCRPGQRDHRFNGWWAAGAPAHHRAARGNRFTLSFLSCCRLSFSGSSVPGVMDPFPVFLPQAEKARSLGAIVYCVGVKDFNETQVKPLPVPRIPAASGRLATFPYVPNIWSGVRINSSTSL